MAAGGGGGGGRPGQNFAGAAFEGRKFGISAFALRCVSVSLYLFFIIQRTEDGVAGWTGGTRTFAPGDKNPRAATGEIYLILSADFGNIIDEGEPGVSERFSHDVASMHKLQANYQSVN